jgi:serpin B
MRIRSFIACTMVLVMACQSGDDGANSLPPALLTALPRALSAPEQAVIAADNQLGFDLLRRARHEAPDSNALLSPLSAGMALGMVLNGAAGATLDSMRLALQLGSTPVADIDAGYRSLINLLAGLDGTTNFSIANSVWVDTGFPVLSTFLAATSTNFDAVARTLDLQAPATVGTINDWVNSRTNGKIPTIISHVPDDEVMYLINAVYFKGKWRLGFDPADTRSAAFTTSDGVTQSVPTMSVSGKLGHRLTSDAELVEMPYGNGAYAMTIVLPAGGHTISDLVNEVDASTFAGWVAHLDQEDVGLTLPRFQFQFARELKGDLSALGMARAFNDTAADFSGIATPVPGNPLFLTNVTQKTFIDVNEDGTEAAAVTSVGIARTTSRETPIEVNRPFLFVLRERLSGTIFFVGQVNRIP